MEHLIARFAADRSGATVVEYGLIVTLIFLVIVGGLLAISGNFNLVMGRVSAALANAIS